jgi:hypothetical protein
MAANPRRILETSLAIHCASLAFYGICLSA